MGPRTVYLVARREVVTRLRSRAFRIGSGLLVAGIVVGALAAQFLAGPSKPVRVGFVGPAQALATPFEAAAAGLQANVTISDVADQSQGESDISANRLDVLVTGQPTAPTALVKTDLDPTIEAALNTAVRQAALGQIVTSAGLDPATVAAQIAAAKTTVRSIEPWNPGRTQSVLFGLFVAYFLMYAIVGYGSQVASGVVQEKSTRIVEIILATVRPGQLLAGKVLGIGLVGLLQVGLVGLTGMAMIQVTHVVTVPGANAGDIVLDVVWFLLGYYLYATIFAALGSLVSRQEDVQTVLFLPIALVVASLLLSYSVVANPTSVLNVVLSLLPPFAPILMPARQATSDVAVWQVLLAIVLTLGTAIALTLAAGRIYAYSVLRMGARVRLVDALRGR
jgi:ABC-2 type transport system permease protein